MKKPSNPHAVALGSMKSERKAKAARINGKLGGRPRKYDSEQRSETTTTYKKRKGKL